MTRHAREDALDDREFELLLEGATTSKQSLQTRFVVLVGGRLGLRPGEIAHIDEDWIDWRKQRIDIPRHDECRKGRFDEICGYCRQQAEQMLEHHDDWTYEDAAEKMWSPKTSSAVRSVPWDFEPRIEIIIERFFDEYDQFPRSRSVVNRRVTRAAEKAPELNPDEVYPHALRSTAATHHAGRGLDILPLQSMFGWAQLATAQVYLADNPENTARALSSVHSR